MLLESRVLRVGLSQKLCVGLRGAPADVLARLEIENVGVEVDLGVNSGAFSGGAIVAGSPNATCSIGTLVSAVGGLLRDDRAERNAAAVLELGAVEDFRAAGHKAAVADRRADDVGVRTNDAPIADRERIL